MKLLQCFLISILFSHCTYIIPIENQSYNNITLYHYYFTIKELCKLPFHATYIGKKKLDSINLTCTQCHNTISTVYVWGYCIGIADEAKVNKLISLLYDGSKEKLTEFLLMSVHELKINCQKCCCYDWQIAPQKSSTLEI